MQKFIVQEKDIGKRLDIFLEEIFPDKTRSNIKNLIDGGFVWLNDKNVKAGAKLKIDQIVKLEIPELEAIDAKAENIPIEIVYQDDSLAVINKPQGMVVHQGAGNHDGTLVNALLFALDSLSGINGKIRPGIVHRLDKLTSGLMVVAKNDNAHVNLAKQIESKQCKRNYLALLEGNLKEDCGVIETQIGRSPTDRKKMAVVEVGKTAVTEYSVRKRFAKYCLVEFSLKTGRTHQIRVHAKYLNHTVVGDEVYGHKSKEFKLNGQLLHAYKLEFTHPVTQNFMSFEIKLPDYFEKIVKKLSNE